MACCRCPAVALAARRDGRRVALVRRRRNGAPPPLLRLLRRRPRRRLLDPTCDFSHIYTTGEYEIASLPDTSSWAAKYGCGRREERDLVDTKAGYIYDTSRQDPPTKSWGRAGRPGKAEVFEYGGCKDGRVVADVVRLDKGHTEGLEPVVTEEIVKLMTRAKGGKIAAGAR